MKVRSFSYMKFDVLVGQHISEIEVDLDGKRYCARITHNQFGESLFPMSLDFVRRQLVDTVMSEIRNQLIDQL